MVPQGDTPAPTVTRHDKIYTMLLGVLGFLLAIAIVTLAVVRLQPTIPADSRNILLVPLFTEGLYLIAILIVFLIRLISPAHRRWPTLGLNILLLLVVPIGTALAVYGFLKIDKDLKANPN
jgi:hypothetical protein